MMQQDALCLWSSPLIRHGNGPSLQATGHFGGCEVVTCSSMSDTWGTWTGALRFNSTLRLECADGCLKAKCIWNDWEKPGNLALFGSLKFVDLAEVQQIPWSQEWKNLNSWVEGARILDVFHISQLDFVSFDSRCSKWAGCWVPWMAWPLS